MNDGWIKLWRKLLKSDMWQNLTSAQRDVAITLLLMVNHEPKKWEWNGEIYECKSGQCITSLKSIKKNCGKGISIQNIRTSLLKLEKWGFLTNESTKSGRLITITNWELYQSDDKKLTKKLTKSQQRTNKELTTNKNDKNDKKNNIYIDIFSHWNSQNIVKHKKLTTNMKQTINARLEDFTPEEIKQAISNYAKIYHSPKYFLKYKFRLEDFLSRGAGSYMEKFLTENDPFSSYLRDEERKKQYEDETPAQRRLRELREKKSRSPPGG